MCWQHILTIMNDLDDLLCPASRLPSMDLFHAAETNLGIRSKKPGHKRSSIFDGIMWTPQHHVALFPEIPARLEPPSLKSVDLTWDPSAPHLRHAVAAGQLLCFYPARIFPGSTPVSQLPVGDQLLTNEYENVFLDSWNGGWWNSTTKTFWNVELRTTDWMW